MSPTLIITISIATLISVVILNKMLPEIKFWKPRETRIHTILGWAQASGLEYSVEPNYTMLASVVRFECFRQGAKRHFPLSIWGTYRGYTFIAGDFRYLGEERSDLGRRISYDFSFVLFVPPFLLREFVVRRETTADRRRARWGRNDIDFESAEFSDHFFVDCDDRRWAYDAISPRTMELLLANPSIELECAPSMLLIRYPTQWRGPEFERLANLGVEFLNNIPPHARHPLPA